VKRTYCRAPAPLKMLMVVGVGAVMESWAFARAVVTCSLPRWFAHRWNYKKNRGMSRRYDIIDWIGGYPFEVARPEEVFRFMRDRGFVLQQLATRSGKGCNLFVFEKASAGENPIRHERAA
jgi:2-polyprenyl-6-hydroxyphenyl methylase/3-demethylubiquinone-9 3-methyltransferase